MSLTARLSIRSSSTPPAEMLSRNDSDSSTVTNEICASNAVSSRRHLGKRDQKYRADLHLLDAISFCRNARFLRYRAAIGATKKR
jgi:hypothetical protein